MSESLQQQQEPRQQQQRQEPQQQPQPPQQHLQGYQTRRNNSRSPSRLQKLVSLANLSAAAAAALRRLPSLSTSSRSEFIPGGRDLDLPEGPSTPSSAPAGATKQPRRSSHFSRSNNEPVAQRRTPGADAACQLSRCSTWGHPHGHEATRASTSSEPRNSPKLQRLWSQQEGASRLDLRTHAPDAAPHAGEGAAMHAPRMAASTRTSSQRQPHRLSGIAPGTAPDKAHSPRYALEADSLGCGGACVAPPVSTVKSPSAPMPAMQLQQLPALGGMSDRRSSRLLSGQLIVKAWGRSFSAEDLPPATLLSSSARPLSCSLTTLTLDEDEGTPEHATVPTASAQKARRRLRPESRSTGYLGRGTHELMHSGPSMPATASSAGSLKLHASKASRRSSHPSKPVGLNACPALAQVTPATPAVLMRSAPAMPSMPELAWDRCSSAAGPGSWAVTCPHPACSCASIDTLPGGTCGGFGSIDADAAASTSLPGLADRRLGLGQVAAAAASDRASNSLSFRSRLSQQLHGGGCQQLHAALRSAGSANAAAACASAQRHSSPAVASEAGIRSMLRRNSRRPSRTWMTCQLGWIAGWDIDHLGSTPGQELHNHVLPYTQGDLQPQPRANPPTHDHLRSLQQPAHRGGSQPGGHAAAAAAPATGSRSVVTAETDDTCASASRPESAAASLSGIRPRRGCDAPACGLGRLLVRLFHITTPSKRRSRSS